MLKFEILSGALAKARDLLMANYFSGGVIYGYCFAAGYYKGTD